MVLDSEVHLRDVHLLRNRFKAGCKFFKWDFPFCCRSDAFAFHVLFQLFYKIRIRLTSETNIPVGGGGGGEWVK